MFVLSHCPTDSLLIHRRIVWLFPPKCTSRILLLFPRIPFCAHCVPRIVGRWQIADHNIGNRCCVGRADQWCRAVAKARPDRLARRNGDSIARLLAGAIECVWRTIEPVCHQYFADGIAAGAQVGKDSSPFLVRSSSGCSLPGRTAHWINQRQ